MGNAATALSCTSPIRSSPSTIATRDTDRAGETLIRHTPAYPGVRLAVRPNVLRIATILLEVPDAL